MPIPISELPGQYPSTSFQPQATSEASRADENSSDSMPLPSHPVESGPRPMDAGAAQGDSLNAWKAGEPADADFTTNKALIKPLRRFHSTRRSRYEKDPTRPVLGGALDDGGKQALVDWHRGVRYWTLNGKPLSLDLPEPQTLAGEAKLRTYILDNLLPRDVIFPNDSALPGVQAGTSINSLAETDTESARCGHAEELNALVDGLVANVHQVGLLCLGMQAIRDGVVSRGMELMSPTVKVDFVPVRHGVKMSIVSEFDRIMNLADMEVIGTSDGPPLVSVEIQCAITVAAGTNKVGYDTDVGSSTVKVYDPRVEHIVDQSTWEKFIEALRALIDAVFGTRPGQTEEEGFLAAAEHVRIEGCREAATEPVTHAGPTARPTAG